MRGDMSDFKDRLKTVISDESVNAFAGKSGVTEGALRKYLSGSSLPGLDKLIAISDAAEVNIEWLATGKGPMMKEDQTFINLELLALAIEVFEKHEKESGETFPPEQKAYFISSLYDLCFNEDYAIETEEGKNAIWESMNAIMLFDMSIIKAIDSEKSSDRLVKVLRRNFTKFMSKVDAELEAESYITLHVLMKHQRRGTLKSLDDIKKVIAEASKKK